MKVHTKAGGSIAYLWHQVVQQHKAIEKRLPVGAGMVELLHRKQLAIQDIVELVKHDRGQREVGIAHQDKPTRFLSFNPFANFLPGFCPGDIRDFLDKAAQALSQREYGNQARGATVEKMPEIEAQAFALGSLLELFAKPVKGMAQAVGNLR